MTAMSASLRVVPSAIAAFGRRAGVVGLVASIAAVAAAVVAPEAFFRSYLVGYLFWLGISLGCLALLMIQHLSGGAWALVIRRVLEAGATRVPLMALLFVPILPGLGYLYEWSHADIVRADEVLRHKSAFLNVPFFVTRAAGYFALWGTLALLLARWSRRQDEASDPAATRSMQGISGPGLVVFAVIGTLAATDWMMSLEPHWYSTMFGALQMAGQALGALSFAIAALVLLARYEPLASRVTPRHLHDLGKLLLAFVMVWAYFGFSQFLIVWNGNLPEETPWFLKRFAGGWLWMALALVAGQFVLPFFLLLSRGLKRDSRRLSLVASLVIFLRLVDLCWTIVPAFETFEKGGAALVLGLVLVVVVALGGIWSWSFASALAGRPMLPLGDPHLEEALAHDDE